MGLFGRDNVGDELRQINVRLKLIDLGILEILKLTRNLYRQGERMSAELDTLTTKVNDTLTVEQSAIELINGLAAQIADLKDDPQALQALSDQLSGKSAELAAAVQANTPSA